MSDRGVRPGVVIALVMFVVGGCAVSATTSPPASSDVGSRPPGTEAPTNFASPQDMLQRYPTMRRQQL
jgi:hypothetical protein